MKLWLPASQLSPSPLNRPPNSGTKKQVQETVRHEGNAYPRMCCHWPTMAIMVLPSRWLASNPHSYILKQRARRRPQVLARSFSQSPKTQHGESKGFNEAKRHCKSQISGCKEADSDSCQGVACHFAFGLLGQWEDYFVAGENPGKQVKIYHLTVSQHILRSEHGLRIAVIVNDIGA